MPAWVISLLLAIARPFVSLWRLMFSLGLSAPTTSDEQNVVWRLPDGSSIIAPSRYVRVTVAAPECLQVEDCIVSARGLTRGRTPLATHSAPLAWTGKKDAERFKPQRLASGDRKQIDVCKYDEYQQRLQFLTDRSEFGTDIFALHGTYDVEIIATGKEIRKGKITLGIVFDGTMQLRIH